MAMTMYYSRAEMEYVEFQRISRIMEAASRGEIDLVETADGPRYMKNGERWEPDMSYLIKDQS